MKKITIIGGGFSGLVSAYYLSRAGYQVDLHERWPSLGGLISTSETPWGIAETAANGLLNSYETQELFADLGLQFASRQADIKKKWIYRGQPSRWPLSLAESLPLLLAGGRLIFQKEKMKPQPLESVREWGVRCFGRATTLRLLEPALQGIFAGKGEELSASLIFSRFFTSKVSPEAMKHNYSITPRGTVAPLGGMQKLITALQEKIIAQGVRLNLSSAVSSVHLQKPGKGFCLIAVPPPAAAELLKERHSELSAKLGKIETLPLVSVTLFKKKSAELRGFGCLFPRDQGFRALGVILNAGLFHDANNTDSERWIFGGATDRAVTELSEQELLALAVEESQKLHGHKVELLGSAVKIWPQAVPYYNLELERIMSDLRKPQSDFMLFGNYNGQLGLSQILRAASQLPKKLESYV